eukprot:scaffold156761_cov48-Tisochrysis_lutea.AAC.1
MVVKKCSHESCHMARERGVGGHDSKQNEVGHTRDRHEGGLPSERAGNKSRRESTKGAGLLPSPLRHL